MKTLRDLFEHLSDMDEEELDKTLHITVFDHEDHWEANNLDISIDNTTTELSTTLAKGCTVIYGKRI